MQKNRFVDHHYTTISYFPCKILTEHDSGTDTTTRVIVNLQVNFPLHID